MKRHRCRAETWRFTIGHFAASAFFLALCTPAPCAMGAAKSPPSPKAVVAVLKELRTQLEWPGLTVKQAAGNLKTPQEALKFVSDEVMLVNYRGSYGGAAGTLRTRVANATDKSILLAALLKQMGVKARLARSDWPDRAQPHQGRGPRRSLPALEKLKGLLASETDEADKLQAALSEAQLQQLRNEINTSAGVIEDLLAAKGKAALLKGIPAPKDVEPTRVDIDWVWVQGFLDGKTWTDMDPVFPEQTRPNTYVKPFLPKPVSVIIRLEACRIGQDRPKLLLQWSGASQKILGHDILLSYFPDGNDIKVVDQPEKVDRWKPQLSCGALHVFGKIFSPSGKTPKKASKTKKPAVGGFGGLMGGGTTSPPKGDKTGCDYLRLVIKFNDPGSRRPWSASFSRIVQYVGSGYDAHGLISVHRIGLGMAFVPVRVAESRMVDEVINIYYLRQIAEGGNAVKIDGLRGYSTRTIQIMNTQFFLPMLSTPQKLKLDWKGPAVFVETYQLRKVNDQLFFASRLDTLHQPFGPQADQPRLQRTLWGLATCAVEARLLKTKSVNQHLLAAKNTLRIISVPGASLRSHVGAEAIQRSVLAEGGLVLESSDAPDSIWAIRPTGDLLGVFSDSHSGVATKGAGTLARSRAAGNAFAALGGGAMATLGVPGGMLVAPLAEYFNELAKAYGKAASVLDNLTKTMETGDSRHMNDDRNNYFQNLGRHLTNAISRGFVRGWAQSVAGTGIGHALGTSGSHRIADRVINGLVVSNLSMPEEFPIFPGVMREAMDAVTVPTR